MSDQVGNQNVGFLMTRLLFTCRNLHRIFPGSPAVNTPACGLETHLKSTHNRKHANNAKREFVKKREDFSD